VTTAAGSPGTSGPRLSALETPGLARRLASALYEALLLLAIALAAGSLFLLASAAEPAQGSYRQILQMIYLGLVFAAYFLWCWLRGGQTLAMKAWRIRLIMPERMQVSPLRALLRFGLIALLLCCAGAAAIFGAAYKDVWLSLASILILCISPAWALIDREGQFLHDRLAGTRLVLLPIKRRPGSAENDG
jgi:uncharacterized RDD family membrane protein YckC